MATIEFENGTKVDFEGNPTSQDVEEIAQKMNLGGQSKPKGLFQEMGGNLKKAWETAKAPQDIASLGIGGGAVANALVNTPFKHAIGAVAKTPGIKQALTPFSAGLQSLKETPIHQAITKPVTEAKESFKESNPRTAEALGGVGDMLKAGLTVSSLGQGYKSVKDFAKRKLVAPQQTQGIENTLTQNLGVHPTDAKEMAGIFNDHGVTSHITSGNYDAAQWMLRDAHSKLVQMIPSSGSPPPGLIKELTKLENAARYVEGLKVVPFNPTPLTKLGEATTGLVGGAKNLATTALHNTAKWGPLALGGGLALDYFIGKK